MSRNLPTFENLALRIAAGLLVATLALAGCGSDEAPSNSSGDTQEPETLPEDIGDTQDPETLPEDIGDTQEPETLPEDIDE